MSVFAQKDFGGFFLGFFGRTTSCKVVFFCEVKKKMHSKFIFFIRMLLCYFSAKSLMSKTRGVGKAISGTDKQLRSLMQLLLCTCLRVPRSADVKRYSTWCSPWSWAWSREPCTSVSPRTLSGTLCGHGPDPPLAPTQSHRSIAQKRVT